MARSMPEVPVGCPVSKRQRAEQYAHIADLILIGWSDDAVRARMAVLKTLHAEAYRIRRGIRTSDPDLALGKISSLRAQFEAL